MTTKRTPVMAEYARVCQWLEVNAGLAPINWSLTYGCTASLAGLKRARLTANLIEYNMIKVENFVQMRSLRGTNLHVARATYRQHKVAYDRLEEIIQNTEAHVNTVMEAQKEGEEKQDELPF